jgi:hypothetical protein
MSEIRCLLTTRLRQNWLDLSKFSGRVDAAAADDILSAPGISRLSRGVAAAMGA